MGSVIFIIQLIFLDGDIYKEEIRLLLEWYIPNEMKWLVNFEINGKQ